MDNDSGSLSWRELVDQYRSFDEWHRELLKAMEVNDLTDINPITENDIRKSSERSILEMEILRRCRSRKFDPEN